MQVYLIKECDCFDRSIVTRKVQPTLDSFILEKSPGQKKNRKPRTPLFRKRNKSVKKKVIFCIVNDENNSVDFNAELLTFTTLIDKLHTNSE